MWTHIRSFFSELDFRSLLRKRSLFFLLLFIIWGILALFMLYIGVSYWGQQRKNILVRSNLLYAPPTQFGAIPTTYFNPYCKKNMPLTLADFHIASSYRPYLPGGNTHDVCSYEAIQLILEKGARFLWLDVWSSNPNSFYDPKAYPIVRGETLLQKYGQALRLDKVCQVIRKSAWHGTNYPLLIYLNIHSSAKENRFVLQKIARCFFQAFKDKLLDKKYSFARYNVAQIPLQELFGHLILLVNTYPLEGNLNELVNGVIGEKSQNSGTVLTYDSAHMNHGGILSKEANTTSVVDFNKTHLGIVKPEQNFTMTNILQPGVDLVQIPFQDPFKYGYSCVLMNYQKDDDLREQYFSFFKKASFVLKKESLRFIPKCQPKKLTQNKQASYSSREVDFMKGFFKHSY